MVPPTQIRCASGKPAVFSDERRAVWLKVDAVGKNKCDAQKPDSRHTAPREEIGIAMEFELSLVVISFPDSVRRERLRAILEPLTIPWRFFDALREPRDDQPRYNNTESVRFWGRGLSKSEIGCAASHLSILTELAKSRPENWLLVIEDDVFLDPSFDYGTLVRLCKTSRIGYLRLYARHAARSRHIVWLGQRELIRFKKAPMGTQAYLISSQKARSFLETVRTISRPIDWEMDRFWANGLYNYALFPFPCLELGSSSSVNKQSEFDKRPSVYDRVVWFFWKSKEALRRLLTNIYLLRQDAMVRKTSKQGNVEF
jgi:GR25 family glycosyltransferase involved in LPS biosynthesis